MKKKINIAVIFGGESPEHNVSLESGRAICREINPKLYKLFCIYISRSGAWFLIDSKKFINRNMISARADILPYPKKKCFMVCDPVDKKISPRRIDVIFPIIHGTTGEDGVLQGVFEILDIPYVGSGVSASSCAINKVMSKFIAQSENIPCLEHIAFSKSDLPVCARKLLRTSRFINQLKLKLRLPFFVKPVSLGSSIGVTKVKKYSELKKAVKLAFNYEDNIMIEKGIEGAREIVCGVLGDDKKPYASVCGEVKPFKHDFFDYDAKYSDNKGFDLILPAKISKKNSEKIRSMSISIFRALNCSGFARIDFLMDPADEDKFYFCEINTIPGFTSHSLYPSLWNFSGIKIKALIERLIGIALKKR
ncbi:MAG: D-alanine--D-alanine ligase [Elusimicrobia bacterium]|nr:D-alanine--D-alanine ligase [Elusimicrobiota bacterium]